MFKVMLLSAFIYVSLQGKEKDGTYNYMLQTESSPSIGYKMSYSTKSKLPFKKNELFYAKLNLSCELDYFAKDWPDGYIETGRLYICNVKELEY